MDRIDVARQDEHAAVVAIGATRIGVFRDPLYTGAWFARRYHAFGEQRELLVCCGNRELAAERAAGMVVEHLEPKGSVL